MLNPLDALIITFFAMSIISILGVALMFFTKNEKLKKGVFYGLSVWALVVAYCNLQMSSVIVAGGLGALAVAAVLVQLLSKKERNFKAAQILTAVSVVAGMVSTFLI